MMKEHHRTLRGVSDPSRGDAIKPWIVARTVHHLISIEPDITRSQMVKEPI
jgi:hypothetical protein